MQQVFNLLSQQVIMHVTFIEVFSYVFVAFISSTKAISNYTLWNRQSNIRPFLLSIVATNSLVLAQIAVSSVLLSAKVNIDTTEDVLFSIAALFVSLSLTGWLVYDFVLYRLLKNKKITYIGNGTDVERRFRNLTTKFNIELSTAGKIWQAAKIVSIAIAACYIFV